MDDVPENAYDAHDKAFAIIPKVGGVLSIIGSLLILRDVYFKMKEHMRIPLTTQMITLITVAVLFIASLEDFLSTWMVPKDSPNAYLASGNTTTCNIQGFISISMFMIIQTAYTMLSALYYVTVARSDWTTQKTRTWTVGVSFLGIPIVVGLGTAIPLLVTQQYNYDGVYSCNIAAYPVNCHFNADVPCTRAPLAPYVRQGLYLYVFACFAFILICLCMLLCSASKKDAQTSEYISQYLQGGSGGNGARSNPVVSQSLRYLAAFFIPNVAFIAAAVMDICQIPLSSTGYLIVMYIYVILWPMFGALNSLVYFRLRYLNEKRRRPEASFTSIVGRTLSITPRRLSRNNDALTSRLVSLGEDDLFCRSLLEDESVPDSSDNDKMSAATATDSYLL